MPPFGRDDKMNNMNTAMGDEIYAKWDFGNGINLDSLKGEGATAEYIVESGDGLRMSRIGKIEFNFSRERNDIFVLTIYTEAINQGIEVPREKISDIQVHPDPAVAKFIITYQAISQE